MGDADRGGLGQNAVQGQGSGWYGPTAVKSPCTPMVPRLIALCPSACQIWRVKLATEVLPDVPVTATMHWAGPQTTARRRRPARRAGPRPPPAPRPGRQFTGGDLGALAVGQDGARALAQRILDELAAMDGRSGQAANRYPGLTCRESSAIPVTSGSRPLSLSAPEGTVASPVRSRKPSCFSVRDEL